MTTYRIVRFYQRDDVARRVLFRGLTLKQAQEHCSDPETASSTATTQQAQAEAGQFGPWFDGYEEE